MDNTYKCKKCNIILTIDNWYPSFIKTKNTICKTCSNKHNNPEKYKEDRKNERLNRRMMVINFYSNKCECCLEDRIEYPFNRSY